MKANRFRVALVVLPFALWALECLGDGILIKDQDAFATGRGNAFVATADNPSAIYFNPAGITQLAGHQLRLGIYALTYQTSYSAPSGSSLSSEREIVPVPQCYYTFTPTNLPVAFGLGVYSPFGLSMEWPETSGFRSAALKGEVQYITVQPVIAWRMHPTLSLGFGPTLNYARTELKQGLSRFAGNDSFCFKGDTLAVGFTAGIRWQPVEQHAFGIVYRSATKLDYDGHTDTTALYPPLSLRQEARAEFVFPQRLTLGWSWRPSPAWNLEFNADWTDWSTFDVVPIRQTVPVPPVTLNWRSNWFFAWGATRQFGAGWHASAGYIFSENSVPSGNFTPLVPDTERHTFSLGAGRETPRWTWDLAYQLTWGVPRTVTGSAPSMAGESADGRYETMAHALAVSVGWKF